MSDLTTRQLEVLTQIALGRTQPETAERLYISSATVNKHLMNTYKTIGAHGAAHAVLIMTMRHGHSWLRFSI